MRITLVPAVLVAAVDKVGATGSTAESQLPSVSNAATKMSSLPALVNVLLPNVPEPLKYPVTMLLPLVSDETPYPPSMLVPPAL